MATTIPTKTTSDGTIEAADITATPEIKALREEANAIIRRYGLFGTATGLIPVMGADVAASTAVQTKMIKDLAELYGYDINDSLLRTALTTGATALGGRLLTGIATSLAASFSPLKMLIGGATQAAISGFMTMETGKLYQMHMERGNDPMDLGVMDIVNHVIKQVQSGETSLNSMSITNQLGGLLKNNQN